MATNSAGSVARYTHENQTEVIRFGVNWNDAGITSGIGKQTLPANAIVLRSYVQVDTAFNAATTNVLSVGIESSTYANMISNSAAAAGSLGLKVGVLSGTAIVPLAADSQVFVMYTQTGTAASAGHATVVIEYIPPNEGFRN